MNLSRSEDEAQFQKLVEQNYAAIWRYVARRIPRSDVDDVVNEVFLVVWRRRREVEGTFVRPWIYGVARGQVANKLRQRGRALRLAERLARLPAASQFSTEPSAALVEQEGPLGVVWRLLREVDREVLLLEAWERLSSREIAQVLNISEAAARQRLSRAHRAARQIRDRLSDGDA